MSFIQWNTRGLQANREELSLLLSQYDPQPSAYKKLSPIVTKLLLSKIIHTMVYLRWKIMALSMLVWVYLSKTQPLTNSCTSILADQHMLLHLYRSLVCSKLNYGRVVYGSARESYLRILDPIQNLSTAALRPCLQNFTCLKYVCISSTK